MTAFALALAAGVAARMVGAPFLAAPLVVALLSSPIVAWSRPGTTLMVPLALALTALAGAAHADAARRARVADCRWSIPEGSWTSPVLVIGVDGPGRVRLRPLAGSPGACRGVLRAFLPRGASPPRVGARLGAEGRWQPDHAALADRPDRAGTLVVERVVALDRRRSGSVGEGLTAALLRVRARATESLRRRIPRETGLALALLVARKDALDPAVRDGFARAGIAHLLAISGFHVGVVAMLAAALLGALGRSRRAAAIAAASAAAVYAGLLGFPDAATRAALMVAAVTAGRVAGRPVLPAGALATAFLILLVIDPAALGRAGFQLSFAGAFGLAVAAGPATDRLRRLVEAVAPGLGGSEGEGRPAIRYARALVRQLTSAVGAALVATASTAPLVAWHFEALPLFGVPATLIAGPLVAAALPGLIAVVALDRVAGLAAVPAAGAEALLAASRWTAEAVSSLPLASVSVARPDVVVALIGAGAAVLLLSGARRVGRPVRWVAVLAGGLVALTLHPVVDRHLRAGQLELYALDVGQGDALALRTPRGRWLVIDAGPGPGDRLVRSLRRVGVVEIEWLVLTHPDADHIGGAPALLKAIPVTAVAGPGTVRGSEPFLDLLSAAADAEVGWRIVSRGDRLDLDGVEVQVLHPSPPPEGSTVVTADPNDRSVVLMVRWNGFTALLTGDAPVAAERLFSEGLQPVDVLKVGHHGSLTSTGPTLMAAARPRWALVSVGRFNRYGHPAPSVLGRLTRAGAAILRTDRQGSIRIRVDAAGRVEILPARAP